MFDFITISNGVVVVQHAASGTVYRCRPLQPGMWAHLALASNDAGDVVSARSHVERAAALRFAEQAAAAVSTAGPET